MLYCIKRLWWLGCLIMTSGCVTQIWESYPTPNYGPSRAEQICHPYGDCYQGGWVTTTQLMLDPDEAYKDCEDKSGLQQNGWWDETVSKGLEVGRCMRSMGFKLARR